MADPASISGYDEHPPRMGFFTDTSICIGCKACEVACKEWNEVPDDLVGWVRNDRKPAGDRLDARSVAAPDFGCIFSDKAAYATGTRRLFPANTK